MVMDSYVRSDIATLAPEKILKDFPKARRKWTDKHLIYIAENVVETAGTGNGHIFYQALKERLPGHFARIESRLPTQYRHDVAISRITSEYEALESEIFLNAQVKAKLAEAIEFKRRSMISAAVKKSSRIKRYQLKKDAGLLVPPPIKPKKFFSITEPGTSANRHNILRRIPTLRHMGAQTDEVIFSSAIPKVMYNDEEVEIHPDAYRLLYTETFLKLESTVDMV